MRKKSWSATGRSARSSRPGIRTHSGSVTARGQPLVDEYAAADAFVFPSRTDTFGLVMLEALACGTPVAAYPVTGPKDVVRQGVTGWLDEDLNVAVRNALQVSREDCRAYAVANGWPKIACRMADNLAVFDWRDS